MRPISDSELQEIKRRFGIVGNSSVLNQALKTAIQVAGTDLTVLLYGESGVGKEVFANLIHQLSRRKHKPFVAVNCAAIPQGTMDSELFGHEKGAFTGAFEARKGYFEYANGGTIFLDEVSEMPIETQAKLLRVLETGEIMRVGSSQARRVNVRVITATNRDLVELIRKGKFREDLFYRISTVPIRVPALRERGEDILLLFQKFAGDVAEKYGCEPIELTPEAREWILRYPWPGNVRQLKHVVEQLTILSPTRKITVDQLRKVLPEKDLHPLPVHPQAYSRDSQEIPSRVEWQVGGGGGGGSLEAMLLWMFREIRNELRDIRTILIGETPRPISEIRAHLPPAEPPPAIADSHSGESSVEPHPEERTQERVHAAAEETHLSQRLLHDEDFIPTIQEMERILIRRALKKYGGRRKDAAQALGISERTLYRKMKELELEVDES